MKKIILTLVTVLCVYTTYAQDPSRIGNFADRYNYKNNPIAKQYRDYSTLPGNNFRVVTASQYINEKGACDATVLASPASTFNYNGGLGVHFDANELIIVEFKNGGWTFHSIVKCGNYGKLTLVGCPTNPNPPVSNCSVQISEYNNYVSLYRNEGVTYDALLGKYLAIKNTSCGTDILRPKENVIDGGAVTITNPPVSNSCQDFYTTHFSTQVTNYLKYNDLSYLQGGFVDGQKLGKMKMRKCFSGKSWTKRNIIPIVVGTVVVAGVTWYILSDGTKTTKKPKEIFDGEDTDFDNEGSGEGYGGSTTNYGRATTGANRSFMKRGSRSTNVTRNIQMLNGGM